MIKLDIITPQKHFLDVSCESVTLPGAMGEFEVIEGHAPLLSLLKSGPASYKLSQGQHSNLTIGEGFAEVDQHHVTVLCEQADLS